MRVLVARDGAELRVGDAPPRQGGESAVYDAVGPGGPCVVKVAHAPSPFGDWLDDERARLEELRDDPRTAALVPRVLHHGVWDDRPFVALERFPATAGEHLGEPVAARLALAGRVARVVAELRAARPDLVHRDLKPANVLVDGERVAITDFGIAREVPSGRSTTTRALLTPDYAAPEQSLPHRAPDPSWDTFGLAATLYHVVVGEPATAPGTHPWRLTERGRRLRTGADDGRGPASAYLDLAGAEALTAEDLRRLDALVHGPLRSALVDALAPDPHRRRGTPETLAEAVARTRPRSTGRVAGARVRWAVGVGVALVALLALGVGPRRPSRVDYPLVAIPAGRAAGPDGSVVEVAPFELGRFEVDQETWRRVTDGTLEERRKVLADGPAEPCGALRHVSLLGDDLPMICVDFLDAARFANALSEAHGLAPAYTFGADPVSATMTVGWDRGADGYRLPTVAEWRRAVTPDDGILPSDPCVENTADASFLAAFPGSQAEGCDDGWAGPSPVGAFPPGPHGIHDGRGNAMEWTWDAGPERTRFTVGGQYAAKTADLPIGTAAPLLELERQVTVGFRLARSPR